MADTQPLELEIGGRGKEIFLRDGDNFAMRDLAEELLRFC